MARSGPSTKPSWLRSAGHAGGVEPPAVLNITVVEEKSSLVGMANSTLSLLDRLNLSAATGAMTATPIRLITNTADALLIMNTNYIGSALSQVRVRKHFQKDISAAICLIIPSIKAFKHDFSEHNCPINIFAAHDFRCVASLLAPVLPPRAILRTNRVTSLRTARSFTYNTRNPVELPITSR